jgi:hypothetical protein
MPLSFTPLLPLKRRRACDQYHSSRVTPFLYIPVHTVNCVQTLKDLSRSCSNRTDTMWCTCRGSLRTVRVFRQIFTLEDAIGSHACSLEANTRVTNGIPLGSSLLLPVDTVNCVQTLKARRKGDHFASRESNHAAEHVPAKESLLPCTTIGLWLWSRLRGRIAFPNK